MNCLHLCCLCHGTQATCLYLMHDKPLAKGILKASEPTRGPGCRPLAVGRPPANMGTAPILSSLPAPMLLGPWRGSSLTAGRPWRLRGEGPLGGDCNTSPFASMHVEIKWGALARKSQEGLALDTAQSRKNNPQHTALATNACA